MLPPTTSTEPTITLSTRDAFAAINGMFGGALQLGGGQDQGVPAVGAAAGFRVPEPRPPRATSESGSRHPAMWQPDCENCGADRGGLFIREDTQFVFAASATEGAESASAAESPPAGAGFCIREDTQFIALTAAEAAPSPASSADGAGFSLPVRADTLFMAAPGPSPASSSGGSMAIRGHPSLGLRSAPATADTTSKMLGDAATDNDVLAVGSLAGSGVAGASKWGFAPGADDMLDLDLTLGADTAALLAADVGSAVAAAGATAALDVHPQAMQLSEGKENIVAVGRTIGVLHSWDVRQPQAASAALRPLCQARAAATGVAVSRDEEAEAALAAGLGACSLGTSDSFDVLASESSGSEAMEPPEHEAPAAATDPLTLDPFHSDFRARCLDSLDPPVTSWPGVVLLSEAEEAAAEAGFRAAGRPGSDLAELWLGGAVYAVSGCCGEGAYARVYQVQRGAV